MVKTFSATRQFAFGRNVPKIWQPTLHADRYLTAVAPGRPLGQRWESKAIHALHDPLGNDQYGDCVYAGILKLDVAWRRNAGDTTSPNPTQADAIALYQALVPTFDPNKPDTDAGGDLQATLTHAKQSGLYVTGAGKVAGWLAVDATKPDSIRRALDLFGGLYTGCCLPDEWLQNPGEGSVWDVAGDPNPENGHCMSVFDYNANGVILNSWGLFIEVTWAAIAKYWSANANGEIYAVIGEDWLNSATKTSPSGLNLEQLTADLAAIK